jgi:hypothetical protein
VHGCNRSWGADKGRPGQKFVGRRIDRLELRGWLRPRLGDARAAIRFGAGSVCDRLNCSGLAYRNDGRRSYQNGYVDAVQIWRMGFDQTPVEARTLSAGVRV